MNFTGIPILTLMCWIFICCGGYSSTASAVDLAWLDQYNVGWTSQSKNAGESMPVSGGDIGLNVWVENDELLLYMGRAGCRDENGALLKPGRSGFSTWRRTPLSKTTWRQ